MNKPKIAKGKCLCGAVTIRFEMRREVFDACHCATCRKWSGGPALSVDAGKDLTLTGQESVAVYRSSEFAERGFCKHCGTHLFYRFRKSGWCDVPLGLIENSESLKFYLQVFVDVKPDQYQFANQTEMMSEAETIAKFMSPHDGA